MKRPRKHAEKLKHNTRRAFYSVVVVIVVVVMSLCGCVSGRVSAIVRQIRNASNSVWSNKFRRPNYYHDRVEVWWVNICKCKIWKPIYACEYRIIYTNRSCASVVIVSVKRWL